MFMLIVGYDAVNIFLLQSTKTIEDIFWMVCEGILKEII